jgi:hypothetical protein
MEAATLVYQKKFGREIRYDAGTDIPLDSGPIATAVYASAAPPPYFSLVSLG